MTTIIVSSAIANKPLNGGNAWVVLNWLRGFQRLGCKVHFVEQLTSDNCVDVDGHHVRFEDSINLRFFQHVMSTFGLGDSATLIYDKGLKVVGLSLPRLRDLAGATDLLVNITGHLTLDTIKSRIKKKAYVDLDPGYTQFWQDSRNKGARLEGHDIYFTIGQNVGRSGCDIPTCGIDWKPLRPPVVLKDWPIVSGAPVDLFTTVASWRGAYGRVQWKDKLFGQKAHEFRKFVDLPQRASHHFEIALDIDAADDRDKHELTSHGWKMIDPLDVAADPESFRAYVQASGAEFSVAQGIYVETRSGWFSDRTVCYLASGKPALVQDTDFHRDDVQAGGLISFRTLEQAIAGAERISANYSQQCRAARAVAEKYFDSDQVLTGLMKQAGLKA